MRFAHRDLATKSGGRQVRQTFRPDALHLTGLVVVTQRDPLHMQGILALLQCRIIQAASCRELPVETQGLDPHGVHQVLEGLLARSMSPSDLNVTLHGVGSR